MTDRTQVEIGLDPDRRMLVIQVPLELLAYVTENGSYGVGDPDDTPEADRLRVTDQIAFAKSVIDAIAADHGEEGDSLIEEMLDEAIEQVIENAAPGFSWPAAGM